jgi:hypothetical protein
MVMRGSCRVPAVPTSRACASWVWDVRRATAIRERGR